MTHSDFQDIGKFEQSQASQLFKEVYKKQYFGFLETRRLNKERVEQRFFKIPDFLNLAATLATQQHNDVFYGVAPRATPANGTAENILCLTVLWADNDGGVPWQSFPLLPLAVINSGHPSNTHEHIYYGVKSPIRNRDEAKNYLMALAIALKADTKSTDVARVLRVPGTRNTKHDTECKLLLVNSDAWYLKEVIRNAVTIQILRPHWIKDQRQSLDLAITGYLAKSGVSQDEVETLLRWLFEVVGDEEGKMRLGALKASYEKLRAGKPIKGYSGLAEYLPEDELSALNKLWNIASTSYKSYIIRDAKGKTIGVDKKALVDDLMEEFTFKSIFGIVRDDILVYQNGVYTHNGEKVIREECERRVGAPLLTTHTIHEIRDRIAGLTFTDRDKFNTEKYIINLENGLLNVKTRELRHHTPDFLSTIRIPITYDLSAKCPRIKTFLYEVLREDDVKVILEFFGYSLIPDYSIPVVLILLGEGNNGKTQLIILLGLFIGEDNYVSVSLQNIENYPFAVANLEGKLLNLQGDLSSKWLSGIGMLKQLSGQDPIYANRKHRDPIQFNNVARLVFASNKPPKIEEDTLAVWRRIMPIDCPNKFEGDNEVKGIVNKIATPQELSGLLNLALDGLDRVLTNGNFSYKGTYEERARHYTLTSDPERVFVEECCDIGPEFEVLKTELYEAYKKFCHNKRIPIKGDSQFGKELRQVPGLSLTTRQHRVEGKVVRWWVGIKLRTVDIDMEF